MTLVWNGGSVKVSLDERWHVAGQREESAHAYERRTDESSEYQSRRFHLANSLMQAARLVGMPLSGKAARRNRIHP